MYAGDDTIEESKFIITKANDTDVVVTAASELPSLQSMRVAYGQEPKSDGYYL